MKSMLYSETELKDILYWRKNEITPQRLFGFDDSDVNHLTYNLEQIQKVYKVLRIKSHPDKYRNKHYAKDAQEVFNLLEEVKQYLLFTLDEPIEDLQQNIFYKYYNLHILPEVTPEDKYEALMKRICDLKKKNMSVTETLTIIRHLIQTYPHLIYCEYDSRFHTYELSNKNIFYLAIQWNEPQFLAFLLHLHPDEVNILKKTTFDLSPIDYAFYHNRFDILICLKKHFGDSWLKTQFEKFLNSTESFDRSYLIDFYLQQYSEEFPKFLSNPMLVPGLIKLGLIEDNDFSILKSAIIHCPNVYLTIENSLRQKLGLGFSVALADRFPILTDTVKRALHRDSPPYNNYFNYNKLKNSVLFFLISNSLGLLAWYFWPMITLLPEIIQLICFLLSFTLVYISIIIILFATFNYFTEIYPEAQKINSILSNNSIFQVQPEKVTQKPEDILITSTNQTGVRLES